MTALNKYERLESAGLWRQEPQAQLREVVVGLRAATLTLSDFKTEMALAQWSLPALRRLNPARLPAVYAPGEDDGETLEIDDPDMIIALDTVSQTLERRRAKPGRLRGSLYAGAGLCLLGLAVFWLPGALVDYTAAMLPQPTRSDLGEIAFEDLTKLTGSACASPAGSAALYDLSLRIDANDRPEIRVLRAPLLRPIALAGGIVLLPQALVEQADGPDAVAGYVLAEKRRAFGRDPTKSLLRYAGLWATLRLLTSGEMSAQSVEGYGQSLLDAQAAPLSDEEMLSSFKTAGITSTPYAKALDASGETTLGLIEADPLPQGSNPEVLDDGSWLGLQAICQ